MATKPQRAFAGFFAALFLISSSAFTVAVIWQATQGDKSNDTTTPSSTTPNTKDKQVQDKLQGTQLTNFTPGTAIPALKTEDTTPGTGQEVKAGDTVTVDYTGAVASTGTIFQSSKDTGQSISFSLKEVIPGWSQGIPGMKVGGTRRLFIPASLSYGGSPPPNSGIPANADLVFDVTLHKIGQ
jgi:FKBP-type peptidyl-prolyl cis-trans isomerase